MAYKFDALQENLVACMPIDHILNMHKQFEHLLGRLLVNPPKTLAQSPARMASTSAAINYIISQITNNSTAETALNQVCVCVCAHVRVCVCTCVCVCLGWNIVSILLINEMCPLNSKLVGVSIKLCYETFDFQ